MNNSVLTSPRLDIDVTSLRSSIAGDVYVPGDEGYDEARTAWNLYVDQRPSVIVMPESAIDVVKAVRFARAEGLRVAPQGTGHGSTSVESLEGSIRVVDGKSDRIHDLFHAHRPWQEQKNYSVVIEPRTGLRAGGGHESLHGCGRELRQERTVALTRHGLRRVHVQVLQLRCRNHREGVHVRSELAQRADQLCALELVTEVRSLDHHEPLAAQEVG